MSARGTRSTAGLSYQVRALEVPGSPGHRRPYACARCSGCGESKEIRVPGHSNNPEAVQEKYRAEGWEFDAWNASRCICAACTEKRKARRHGESGRKEGETTVKPMQTRVSVTTPAVPQEEGGASPPNKPALTVEERTRVRAVLGGTFDEASGQYSEGWSDARVAKEAGDLPPKLVTDLRELAFGPLKSVSELDVLRAEIAALEQRTLDEIAKLRALIEAAARALGVRA